MNRLEIFTRRSDLCLLRICCDLLQIVMGNEYYTLTKAHGILTDLIVNNPFKEYS